MKKLGLLGLIAATAMIASVPAFAGDEKGTPPSDPPKMERHGPRGMMMFERADANKDGIVTEEEFLTEAKTRFANIDANSDKQITEDEMTAFHDKMREKMQEMRGKHRQGKEEPHETPPAE